MLLKKDFKVCASQGVGPAQLLVMLQVPGMRVCLVPASFQS